MKDVTERHMLTNDHIEMFWGVAKGGPGVQEGCAKAMLELITKIVKHAQPDQVDLILKLA